MMHQFLENEAGEGPQPNGEFNEESHVSPCYPFGCRRLCHGDRRARIRADRRTPDELTRARDDADHARRLATKIRHLPWQQLDALDTHAHIAHATGTDGRWAAQANRLREQLIPDDLDADPLSTIEAESTD